MTMTDASELGLRRPGVGTETLGTLAGLLPGYLAAHRG